MRLSSDTLMRRLRDINFISTRDGRKFLTRENIDIFQNVVGVVPGEIVKEHMQETLDLSLQITHGMSDPENHAR